MSLSSKVIKQWLRRIESSDLPINAFLERYDVPFSRANYFRYKRRFADGDRSIEPQRGRNKKLGEKEELFLRGIFAGGATPSVGQVRGMLESEFNVSIGRSTVRRTVERLFPVRDRRKVGRPVTRVPNISSNAMGGFELIVAVAYYLKWPQRAAAVVASAVRESKKGQRYAPSVRRDMKGRGDKGQFTCEYNQRNDVRTSRFTSVSDKRSEKRWESMGVMKDKTATLSRKCLAILSLPVVTANGSVRNINLALGQTLGHLCGFNYKQATITKFLSELKYLGIADCLLRDLPLFWQECWGEEASRLAEQVVCYYVDGNTKAVWSSKRVKQNKVTMLGRVMGCLEQVFIHDGYGHPIYFETHSGHAPVGEHILGLFDKIESTIMDAPGSKTQVCRAIVMDGSSNSVGTIRAFAAQEKFHFITTLDDNQWSERKVCSRSYPVRYRHGGNATLHDLNIELADSKDSKYLIVSRAIRINWDNDKETFLLTSLPKTMVDASEVVYAYFRRWPAQESKFRERKAAVSLNRVCGYGKKLVTNERVMAELEKLTTKKETLEPDILEPMADIAEHDKVLARLIPQERRLRQKTTVKQGQRIIPASIREKFEKIGGEIKRHESAKKKIEKEHAKEFRAYRKTKDEWLRLQSKTMVYELDVELDQIMTYFRASLAHLCAYFLKHFLGGQPITLALLFHRINQLQAHVEVTRHERKVTLTVNNQDPAMMTLIRGAIVKLNELKIRGDHGRMYRFAME